MGEPDGLLLRILRGTSDANIPFDGLCQLLRRLGLAERIRGSHHIFTKEGVEEILNLQPKGRQAKPYQVKCAVSSSNTALEGPQMSHDTRYEIILYWSEEDHAFIAEVPELPGCAADGATYQEALANVQTIMTEWIETAQELGRPIPQPKGRLMFA